MGKRANRGSGKAGEWRGGPRGFKFIWVSFSVLFGLVCIVPCTQSEFTGPTGLGGVSTYSNYRNFHEHSRPGRSNQSTKRTTLVEAGSMQLSHHLTPPYLTPQKSQK